jgi:hypothetical protein
MSSNLDDLLKQFQQVADASLESVPLLQVVDAAAGDAAGAAEAYAMSLMIGCLGIWLGESNGLAGPPVERLRNAGITAPSAVSPGDFAQRVLDNRLLLADVAPAFQAFVKAYVRDLNLYPSDFHEANVVGKALAAVESVPDSAETAAATGSVIEQRYRAFSSGRSDWGTPPAPATTVDLTDAEKTPAGWLRAFEQVRDLAAVPAHRHAEALGKFWALVDHAQGSPDPQVARALLRSFTRQADAGVQQSVLNVLASMPFAVVWPAIAEDLVRLREEDDWLGSILGSWGGDLTDDQLSVIAGSLSGVSAPGLAALRAAVRDGERRSENWARRLAKLL